jgi:hypothetical protein
VEDKRYDKFYSEWKLVTKLIKKWDQHVWEKRENGNCTWILVNTFNENIGSIMRLQQWKKPTIASCRMNGAWTDNNFLLGSNSFVDSIVSIVEVIDRGGLQAEWLIKSLLLLFVCWKKEYWKNSNVEVGEIDFFLITKQICNVTIK